MTDKNCPYEVGDWVIFNPSDRTKGLYQNLERFGVAPGERLKITEIRNDTYLYFGSNRGGWPWNEFTLDAK